LATQLRELRAGHPVPLPGPIPARIPLAARPRFRTWWGPKRGSCPPRVLGSRCATLVLLNTIPGVCSCHFGWAWGRLRPARPY
jgi:hypothetical protein